MPKFERQDNIMDGNTGSLDPDFLSKPRLPTTSLVKPYSMVVPEMPWVRKEREDGNSQSETPEEEEETKSTVTSAPTQSTVTGTRANRRIVSGTRPAKIQKT